MVRALLLVESGAGGGVPVLQREHSGHDHNEAASKAVCYSSGV